MNRKIVFILSLLLVITFILYKYIDIDMKADTILVNGKIYTLNSTKQLAEAIAIKGSNILAVGSSNELLEKYTCDQIIDLNGKTVIPGLIDSHAHLFGLGQMLSSINLNEASSAEEVAEKVRLKVAQIFPNEWIYGRGWDQTRWQNKIFPTKEILDRVSPNNPVFLSRIDGHAIWVNQKALDIAGITSTTQEPIGGRIIKDIKGEPTGIFIDNAIDLVKKVFPQPSDYEVEKYILLAAQECLKAGLTEIHDMGLNSQIIRVYKKLADENRLPLRIYGAIDAPSITWNEMYQNGPIIDYGDGKLTIRAVKMYADGALGSRGAALFEDYSDEQNNRGLILLNESEQESIARQAIKNGFQVCIHAIGDRANNMVLNLYEKLIANEKKSDLRLRIEHAQVLKPCDILRFSKLNVFPSMQPVHAISDMDWAEKRLGKNRIQGAYAWKSLLNTGVIIPSGSDFPNDFMHPLLGFYAAVTRTDLEGNPKGGWYPYECMTPEEALKSYTKWAAFASFRETVKGTIEVGKLADITVLSRDILKIPVKEIPKTEIEMTIIAGKILYSRQCVKK